MEKQKNINDLCLSIIKEIWEELGPGYDEVVYQRGFEVLLGLSNIPYERKRGVQVFLRGYFVGDNEIDLIVNGEIVIELKAIGSILSPKEEAQVIRYMKTLNISKGILVNFPPVGKKDKLNEPEVKCLEV